MLLDPADETLLNSESQDLGASRIGSAIGTWADEERRQCFVALEQGWRGGAHLVLETAHEAGEQSGGGDALPLGEAGLIGQQGRRGDGKTLQARPAAGAQHRFVVQALSFRLPPWIPSGTGLNWR
jgi:hypothetical protein